MQREAALVALLLLEDGDLEHDAASKLDRFELKAIENADGQLEPTENAAVFSAVLRTVQLS